MLQYSTKVIILSDLSNVSGRFFGKTDTPVGMIFVG